MTLTVSWTCQSWFPTGRGAPHNHPAEWSDSDHGIERKRLRPQTPSPLPLTSRRSPGLRGVFRARRGRPWTHPRTVTDVGGQDVFQAASLAANVSRAWGRALMHPWAILSPLWVGRARCRPPSPADRTAVASGIRERFHRRQPAVDFPMAPMAVSRLRLQSCLRSSLPMFGRQRLYPLPASLSAGHPADTFRHQGQPRRLAFDPAPSPEGGSGSRMPGTSRYWANGGPLRPGGPDPKRVTPSTQA
ncbi:hypothetical protein J2852_004844 [Azospirillum soli]|nr:hypothetical protein [Azospirillum soli]